MPNQRLSSERQEALGHFAVEDTRPGGQRDEGDVDAMLRRCCGAAAVAPISCEDDLLSGRGHCACRGDRGGDVADTANEFALRAVRGACEGLQIDEMHVRRLHISRRGVRGFGFRRREEVLVGLRRRRGSHVEYMYMLWPWRLLDFLIPHRGEETNPRDTRRLHDYKITLFLPPQASTHWAATRRASSTCRPRSRGSLVATQPHRALSRRARPWPGSPRSPRSRRPRA